MSFILDALRKSETQRQQGAAPGIADARYRRLDSRRSIWPPILVLVLVANALLLAVLLLRAPGGDVAASRVTQPAPLPPPLPAASQAPREIRSLEAELAEPEMAAATANAPPVSATPPAVGAAPSAAPPASPRPATAPARAGGLQSLQELLLAGELELPPLRIDIHVFADTRDQRFVFINMAKYREGERLREGPVLETITGDGVILEYQGKRFSLARE